MTAALKDKPAVDFPQPEGVVSILIDPETGYPAAEGCPVKREEFFLSGTGPAETCPKHGGAGFLQDIYGPTGPGDLTPGFPAPADPPLGR
jgi:membrane carboxypeptidase/penicillin-binding protein